MRKYRYKRGQTLVEFLMVIMIVFMMLGFALESANLFRIRSFLNLSAFYAARSFAVEQDEGLARNIAALYVRDFLVDDEDLDIEISKNKPNFGEPFDLLVRYKYQLSMPWLSVIYGEQMDEDGKLKVQAKVGMISD